MNWPLYLDGLIACLSLSTLVWLISVVKRDVSIVDSWWSLLFLAAVISYMDTLFAREWIVLSLVAIWGIRLCLHISIRSWGEPEDHRYQVIREKYSPGFAYKSWGIIFVFQAILAWIITLPLFFVFSNPAELTPVSMLAIVIVVFGISYESIADWQLHQFKNQPHNKNKVMDQGLWRYSRHPNYFGEAIIWWGFSLFAIEQGYWWSLVSPLLLTFLLLKFSGVSLLEQTISERRPAYRNYKLTTNAFFPGRKKFSNENIKTGEQS